MSAYLLLNHEDVCRTATGWISYERRKTNTREPTLQKQFKSKQSI